MQTNPSDSSKSNDSPYDKGIRRGKLQFSFSVCDEIDLKRILEERKLSSFKLEFRLNLAEPLYAISTPGLVTLFLIQN